jgi:hypothetical protein
VPSRDRDGLLSAASEFTFAPSSFGADHRLESFERVAVQMSGAPPSRVESNTISTPPLYDDYDIHPDGKTLALVRPAGDARGREITLVLNWLTELRRVGRREPDVIPDASR